MKMYHVINPYVVDENSEEHLVQSKTIESIKNAIEFAKGAIDVALVVKVDDCDYQHFKNFFTEDNVFVCKLTQSSSTIGKEFNIKRELPILKDLVNLNSSAESKLEIKEDDYVVFTNMDICLQPFFYVECARIINKGIDTFVVNRRTIDKSLLHRPLVDGYQAEGEKHIGHDCFVLPHSKIKHFTILEHILGIGFVFRPFLLNCIVYSEKFHEFDDVYFTFHYGDDMEWKNEKYADYLEHNKDVFIDVFNKLKDKAQLNYAKNQKWYEKFFKLNFLDWSNNVRSTK